ncbi:hypothetical protein A2296_02650 [candidate division CPR3 bacterium RIFOXYB2_FULL_35_8]|nr:MAG: hypothetical protein A2250_00070 [candidate division CPR3 bacterium RIFOXYA2_FULL_35_13]OGB76609.1 MAG: hypothetical protein A2476_01865 [candidate division CPR3 bacterium RIFOXYC2_FULL_35_7]OGB79063.1 MAG: hypothetical protein A2296_02650 [candidate division CPR3 bacterium RIFOXYB2_FULL_35_8]
MFKKLNLIVFLILIATLVTTYFTRNNYRNIDNIHPAILTIPKQESLKDNKQFTFDREGYRYEVTPLFDYEINGFIVSSYNYAFIRFYKRDNVFPVDLCMLWGKNMETKIYQSKDVNFSQDTRFCYFSYTGEVSFNHDEISNNHIVVDNDMLEKQFTSLNSGDQVRIKGKLVNIKATSISKLNEYDPPYFEWNTSTTREDSGAGACETIYVEELEILQKGNHISALLFTVSIYALIVYTVINIILILIPYLKS